MLLRHSIRFYSSRVLQRVQDKGHSLRRGVDVVAETVERAVVSVAARTGRHGERDDSVADVVVGDAVRDFLRESALSNIFVEFLNLTSNASISSVIFFSNSLGVCFIN